MQLFALGITLLRPRLAGYWLLTSAGWTVRTVCYYPCSLNLRTAHTPTAATTANPSNQTKNRTGRSKNNGDPSIIPLPIMCPIPSMHRSVIPIVLLPSVAGTTTTDTCCQPHGPNRGVEYGC